MSDPFEVETLRGHVVIEFGLNRWALVAVGDEEGQRQVDTRQELAAYLRERGLSNREADEFSQEAWKRRPRNAGQHVARSREGLMAATGFSSGTMLVLVIAIVLAFIALTVYVFVLHH